MRPIGPAPFHESPYAVWIARRPADAKRTLRLYTTEGTPQGGICSPVLANRTLDGLEGLLQQRFGATRRRRQRCKVHLVRYADDFPITGTSKELLRDEVQPLVAHFLKERGLELSHEKTSITHIDDGFDFLGQNVRRYGTKLFAEALPEERADVRAG